MGENSKEMLIQYAKFCHDKAMQANQYWLTIQQFQTFYQEGLYQNEIKVSPCFYTIVLMALNNSLILELAKLYDADTKSLRLRDLMNKIRENIELFPTEKEIPVSNVVHFENGEIQNDSPNEAVFCKITFDPKTELNNLNTRIKETKDIWERLRQLRIKIYAHSDNDILKNYGQILANNSLGENEIETLIKLAFDIADFVLVKLTGEYIHREYTNSDDLERTLRLVRCGKEYYENVKIPNLLKDFN